MAKTDIKLTNSTVKNIQKMAPLLTKRQQYITLGMILAQVGEGKQKELGSDEKEGRKE